ncbi:MAG: hypothetical protein DRJ03_15040 [Chloroflexi bacterium]|nr:MAG: hypothetical protein DRJ03_15040 [Chloroflexota bacterium]
MISILFLAADPADASRLRLGEEFREIQEKLKLARLREHFKLELPQLSVRPADISQALLDVQPQIVHFSGHGASLGALCFENPAGKIHLVQPGALAALFEQFANQVNCVLLNACYSETQAKAIAEHIEYVIGMNQAVDDKAAIAFAIGFYQALGAGRTIEESYKLGCVQIRLQGIAEHLTPILLKGKRASVSPVLTSSIAQDKSINVLQLPPRQYREFIGRQIQLDDIENALNDTLGRWIIGIDGIGGIGKTALAREITERLLAKKSFEKVVWEQSHRDITMTKSSRGLTYDGVLDAISYQLEAFDLLQIKGKEKEARVKNLLRKYKTLVVLDNLETAQDAQNAIVNRLASILSFSKALLTSRHRFSGDVFSVHLTGLVEEDAIDLIHREAKNKNVSQVENADTNELRQLVISSSGSPLALKLVVGQLGHLPLKIVLEQLSLIHIPEDGAEEDDYVSFYKGIFMPSWKLLPENSQSLLVSMANFPAGIGGTFESLKEISGLSNSILIRSIDELWRLSLLEVEKSLSLNNIRYYLHVLTQNFILSDIVRA